MQLERIAPEGFIAEGVEAKDPPPFIRSLLCMLIDVCIRRHGELLAGAGDGGCRDQSADNEGGCDDALKVRPHPWSSGSVRVLSFACTRPPRHLSVTAVTLAPLAAIAGGLRCPVRCFRRCGARPLRRSRRSVRHRGQRKRWRSRAGASRGSAPAAPRGSG